MLFRPTGDVELPRLAHGELADWENGAKAEFNPWPNGLPPPAPPPPPPPPPPPLLGLLAMPPLPAKLGAERPRFHNPVEDGLKWDEQWVGLGGPPLPPLDQGDEKVDEAGDLLALITPGSRKLDGELGPDRDGVDDDDIKLGLRWWDPVMGRRCWPGLGGECGDSGW